MDYLTYIKDHLHIDPIIVLIVIAAGFFQNRYLAKWNISKDDKTASALRTLVVSGVVSIIYMWLSFTPRDAFASYFLSYFLATSMYELLIRPVTKWLIKITGNIGGEDKPYKAPKDDELQNK